MVYLGFHVDDWHQVPLFHEPLFLLLYLCSQFPFFLNFIVHYVTVCLAPLYPQTQLTYFPIIFILASP